MRRLFLFAALFFLFSLQGNDQPSTSIGSSNYSSTRATSTPELLDASELFRGNTQKAKQDTESTGDGDTIRNTGFDPGFLLLQKGRKLRVGGFIQVDGRYFTHRTNSTSKFFVRRARLFLEGVLGKEFGYLFTAAWDRQLPPHILQAWVETLAPFYARVKVGLFKVPFSLEALRSNLYWDFAERSLGVRNFIELYEPGVMVYGTWWGDRIEYGIGGFNSRTGEPEEERRFNFRREMNARLVVAPFLHNSCSPLQLLYLGSSFSAGNFFRALTFTEFRTGGETQFWLWRGSLENRVFVDNTRIRWGFDLEWMRGPYSVYAEYLNVNWNRVEFEPRSIPFHIQSGYLAACYILTGEDKPRNAAVIPFRNFDFHGGRGAFEIAARYEFLHMPSRPLDEGFAVGANNAHGPTFALNWYLNPLMMIKADYQFLHFNRTITLHDSHFRNESVFTLRAQVIF